MLLNVFNNLQSWLSGAQQQVASGGFAGESLQQMAGELEGFQAGLDGEPLGDQNLKSVLADTIQSAKSGNVSLFASHVGDLFRRVAPLARRENNEGQLANFHGQLKRLLSSRHLAVHVPDTSEDKTFLRAIVGGLAAFLGDIRQQSHAAVAGKVEEVLGQIEDPAIQAFAASAGIIFSDFEAPAPAAPAATATATVTEAGAADSVRPAAEAVAAAPFDYHPESEDELDPAFEFRLSKIPARLEESGIAWPYDFIRWARTLYLLAGDLPNGDAARVKSNVTHGLTRLLKLPSVTLLDIRRIFGAATLSVGRPLELIPKDWPKDFPNAFGSALMTFLHFGETEKSAWYVKMAGGFVSLWTAAESLENKDEIKGSVSALARALERSLLSGEEIEKQECEGRLMNIAMRIPSEARPQLDLRMPPPAGPIPQEKPISQAEWIRRCLDFLVYEKGKWGRVEGSVSHALDRVTRSLQTEDFSSSRARALLDIVFHLTLTYRQMMGIQGDAAFALGKDPDWPLTQADRAEAMEVMAKEHTHLDCLQEWADWANLDENGYPKLLGAEGLPELVGRYVVYLRAESEEALHAASRDFVLSHPELKFSEKMGQTLLSYFLGLESEELDQDLLREITTVADSARSAGPSLDAEKIKFVEVEPDRYTPYGRIFGRIILEGNVLHHGRGRNSPAAFFGMYLSSLEMIFRLFKSQTATTGMGDFDSIYEKVVKNPRFQATYRETYRRLFQSLLQFLDEHADMADLVENAILTGDTKLEYPKKKLPAGGGPKPEAAPAPERDAEAVDVRGTTEEMPAVLPPSSPPPPAPPASLVVDESQFGIAAVVSPTAIAASPFVLPMPLISAGEAVVTGGAEAVAEPVYAKVVPAPVLVPAELKGYALKWGLGEKEKGALNDWVEAASLNEVLKALDNVERRRGLRERNGQILTDYAAVVELNRITPRGKRRLVELLGTERRYSKAILLLSVAAQKPVDISLDQIFPEPVQLGRKGGRYLFIDKSGREPFAVARPAMNPEEGFFRDEAAVTAGNKTILQWNVPEPEDLDIGARAGFWIGDIRMLGSLARAKGAMETGLRNGVIWIVTTRNADVTERARNYFFKQHPQGILIVWKGRNYIQYALQRTEAGLVEEGWQYDFSGKKTLVSTRSLRQEPGELGIFEVTAEHRHPQTSRGIENSTKRAMERLESLGEAREAIRLKVVRDAAIRAVGFLPPLHEDADRILRICSKFETPHLAKEAILGIKLDLDRAVSEIEHRFDVQPFRFTASKAPVPAPPAPPAAPAAPVAVPEASIAEAPPPVQAAVVTVRAMGIDPSLAPAFDEATALLFLKLAGRLGEEPAKKLVINLGKARCSFGMQKEALQAMAAIAENYSAGDQAALLDLADSLAKGYLGHYLLNAHEQMTQLASLAREGIALEGLAPWLVRFGYSAENIRNAFAMAKIVGNPKWERFMERSRACAVSSTSINQTTIQKLMVQLLFLKESVGAENIIRVVDQILEIPERDIHGYVMRFNRLLFLGRLGRQEGMVLARISLDPATLYGGLGMTLEGRVLLVARAEAGKPFHVEPGKPIGGGEGIANALAPSLSIARRALQGGEIQGVTLVLFDRGGITASGREALWRNFGVGTEVWIFETGESMEGEHYRLAPAAPEENGFLGREMFEKVHLGSEGPRFRVQKAWDRRSDLVAEPGSKEAMDRKRVDKDRFLTPELDGVQCQLQDLIGGATEAIDSMMIKLEEIWGGTTAGILERIETVMAPPAQPDAGPPEDLVEIMNMLKEAQGEDAAEIAHALDTVARYHLLGFVVKKIWHSFTAGKGWEIEWKDGVWSARMEKGVTPPSLTLLRDKRLLLEASHEGLFDFSPFHRDLLGRLAEIKKNGRSAVFLVRAPEGIAPRSLRFFFQIFPQGAVVCRLQSGQMVHYSLEAGGTEVAVDWREPQKILGRRPSDPQPGDLFIRGLSESPQLAWDPASVSWPHVLRRGGAALRDLLDELTDSGGPLLGELSMRNLESPSMGVGDALRRHIQNLQSMSESLAVGETVFEGMDVSAWESTLQGLEARIMEAFSNSADRAAGVEKIRGLPKVLHEAKELRRAILKVELEGCRRLYRRMDECGIDLPVDLESQRALLLHLTGQVTESDFLNGEFLQGLRLFRTVIFARANYFAGNWEKGRNGFEFASRKDLELPPANATIEELAGFLAHYGFAGEKVGTSSKFEHSGGTSITLPNKLAPGRDTKNKRATAIRAVEEALRREGRMAPA